MNCLECKDLIKIYGKRQVVSGVTMRIAPGEIVGLLGPNGAGKTTSFYMIVGIIPPNSGNIFLGAQDLTPLPLHRRAKAGIGYLPQEESIFRELSVKDNLWMIAELLFRNKKEGKEKMDKVLEEMGLNDLRDSPSYTLSGGERRRLELARTLIGSPKFLLLDEPFAGVDPIKVSEIQDMILQLKSKNYGILITDHNVRETLATTDRSYIIDQGTIIASGRPDELVENEKVRKVYLGESFKL